MSKLLRVLVLHCIRKWTREQSEIKGRRNGEGNISYSKNEGKMHCGASGSNKLFLYSKSSVTIFRIPDKDGPKRKYGFVDFDDYDAVDMVVTQREHYIGGVRSVYNLSIALYVVSVCLSVSPCQPLTATMPLTWW